MAQRALTLEMQPWGAALMAWRCHEIGHGLLHAKAAPAGVTGTERRA